MSLKQFSNYLLCFLCLCNLCLSMQFIGEGNGNPLQYSCLENPMDGGAWQAGPWNREESDTTERLPFHFSLSCIGEGNGNPLEYSCLEDPRDGGAWWAGVYGVAQSRTRLKRLSIAYVVHKKCNTHTLCHISHPVDK